MSWSTGHAVAVALVLGCVMLAPVLLLPALDAESALAPSLGDERVLTLERVKGVLAVTAAGADARVAFTRPLDLDPARDALVIVAPRVGYSNEEADAIAQFLTAGGRVLVADDSGVSADLLSRLGAGVTSGSAHVYTPGFHVNPRHIVTLSTDVVPGLPDELVLARPALVTGGTTVLRAPELAWADLNANGRPDLNEPVERGFALAALARVGDGELLVVGTPHTLDADRFPVAARAFLMFASVNGTRTLVFDEAHRALADPAGVNALLASRVSPVIGGVLLTFTFITVGAVALAPRFEREAPRRRVRPPRDMNPQVLAAVIGELDSE